MRKFSSYGPVDRELHYYVPRQELVDGAFQQLLGDDPNKGGHYITVWAPRQTGKTWIMREVFLNSGTPSFTWLSCLCNISIMLPMPIVWLKYWLGN